MAQQLLPLYLRNTQIEANGTGTNVAPGKPPGQGLASASGQGLGPGSTASGHGLGPGSTASVHGLGGGRARAAAVDIDTVVPHSYLAGAPPLGGYLLPSSSSSSSSSSCFFFFFKFFYSFSPLNTPLPLITLPPLITPLPLITTFPYLPFSLVLDIEGRMGDQTQTFLALDRRYSHYLGRHIGR